jgi:4-hydroxy-tetrahydrodipicolinate synthase
MFPLTRPAVVPVVPTPFDDREAIDEAAFERLIEFAAMTGVEAICLPAYGSEFYKLSETERMNLVRLAVVHSRGRVRVIAQCNHPSSRIAGEFARCAADAGADVIAFALPRIFTLSEDDLLRYAAAVAGSVSLPVLVQDFNPGGAAVGAAFARRLREVAPNFVALKIEEPLMASKVAAIGTATGQHVAVLEGWGGMYLIELLPAGIAGTMPGLAMCDLFGRVGGLAQSGQLVAATDIFQAMLPQIVYSLQSMEFFHHCEKRLLMARGVLRSARVREATMALDPVSERYIDRVNDSVLRMLEQCGLPLAP